MSHGGRAHEEETHSALGAHPGHARPAAGDRRLHAHYGGLQVEQTQVRFGPGGHGRPDRLMQIRTQAMT